MCFCWVPRVYFGIQVSRVSTRDFREHYAQTLSVSPPTHPPTSLPVAVLGNKGVIRRLCPPAVMVSRLHIALAICCLGYVSWLLHISCLGYVPWLLPLTPSLAIVLASAPAAAPAVASDMGPALTPVNAPAGALASAAAVAQTIAICDCFCYCPGRGPGYYLLPHYYPGYCRGYFPG